uniref:Uncharacterized protein n=1 Tax=Globisporangium ultimum (strain ATCC 200006 / CBS 805.95 / DAOM BR144) TaxID=431595 RepID=K3WYG3_GLOUD
MRAKKSSRAPKFPAPQQRKRQTQRVEEHDDDVWEDLVVETRKAAAIRTFQINGLVALPSVLQATVVAAGVFYVFGSVLLFCAVTLASYVLLMGYSSVTSEKDEDEMLECVTTFAHLERRFRCGTLRFTDCIHYVLYKILRAIECIKTLHRSMLDYSFTVSITRSSAYHDLLELVETKEEQTHSSTASSLGTKQRKTNTITATQKKKLKKQQRMKTMTTTYTGKITIENIVGGSQVVAVPAKETKEPGKQQLQIEQSPPASATLPLLNIPVLRAIKSAPASASKAARDLKQDLTVVLKQLKGEELLPTLASPQASLFSHSKPLTQPTSERKSVDKKELKQATKR